MAFNSNRFTRQTVSYNSGKITLQNSVPDNGPGLFTYATTDTLATVMASNYFSDMAVDLSVDDLIYAVCSDRSTPLQVIFVDIENKFVTVEDADQSGVTAIIGTQYQVYANGTFGTHEVGNVTLTLPQNIATTSSPTFADVSLTGITPYAVICGGITDTNPLQNVSGVGTTGQILTSNDAGALPSWKSPAALTKTDDTNVTVSLGGSPATALLQAVSLTLGWTGDLAVGRGGTGLSALTIHDLIIGNGTSAVTLLAPSATSGIPLISKGSSADPAYGTAVVSGGGTGNTTFTAYSVICAGTTATGAFQNVSGVGTAGQVLTSNDAGALPSWQAPPAGEIPIGTLIDFAGTSVPTGYLQCDGSAVSRATYAALFTAISTTWGVGDGSTTFNLPDFRRHAAVGSGGSGSGTLGNAVGNTGGTETVTLTVSNMPDRVSCCSVNTASTQGFDGGSVSQTWATPNGAATWSGGGGVATNILQPSAIVLKCIRYQ